VRADRTCQDLGGAIACRYAEFRTLAECDALQILGDTDAAGTLLIESPDPVDTRLELGAAAVGSIVVVFTLDEEFDPQTAGDRLLGLMSSGVAKIDALRS
jgi:HAMP domain-containing protein